MYRNCTNADIHCTVYEEKKGFIDNKTNVTVWIVLFCASAYSTSTYWMEKIKETSIIFWPCGWAVENLARCCADLLFLSFADLVVRTQASSALWPLSLSAPSVLVLNLKVRELSTWNTPFGEHFDLKGYLCTDPTECGSLGLCNARFLCLRRAVCLWYCFHHIFNIWCRKRT